jgi:hypothetical protein
LHAWQGSPRFIFNRGSQGGDVEEIPRGKPPA